MDANVTRAAETIASHAVLLLAISIGIIGLAAGAIALVFHLARRHQPRLMGLWNWLLAQRRRIPAGDRALQSVRALVPSSYVAVHLALGLLATAALIGFVIIAEEVTTGKTIAAFDVAFAQALYDSASPHWRRVFHTITWFGSGEVLAVASVLIAAFLLIRARYVLATGWIISQAGGGILIVTLKNAFARTRPPFPDAQLLASWSFPSGHALATFVFCGMGAYLLLRLSRSAIASAFVVAGALAWCVVMGFSRLYLGVHFASDVMAGLIAATAWVAICVSGVQLGLRQGSTGRLPANHFRVRKP